MVLKYFIVFFCLSVICVCTESEIPNLNDTTENLFRSQKVNLLWNKARKQLTEQKMKRLYKDLKTHDKEAMALKKLKADGMDKEGLREAEVRRIFNGIMAQYGIAIPSEQQNSDKGFHLSPNQAIFKDKKIAEIMAKSSQSWLGRGRINFA